MLVCIRRGDRPNARDLLALRERRRAMIDGVRQRPDGFDGFLCPTVAIVAPRLDALDDDDAYARINLLILRKPPVVDVLDGCGISIPMHELLRIGAWIQARP